jgi:hypothetical protein
MCIDCHFLRRDQIRTDNMASISTQAEAKTWTGVFPVPGDHMSTSLVLHAQQGRVEFETIQHFGRLGFRA